MMRWLERAEERWGYLRYRDNWHKGLGRALCWLGRHDYEFDGLAGPDSARLECFYCLHGKVSFRINRGDL